MPTRTFTLKIPIVVTGAGPAKAAIGGVASAATTSAGAHTKAAGSASAHGKALGGLSTQARSASAGLGSLQSILAGIGLGAFAREVLQAGIKMENIGAAMRFATGSAQGAKIEIGFLKEETKRLGLEFSSSAERYAKLSAALKGTGVDVREIFSAVGEASAVLGLSADQTERSFYALEQMAGKGVVSMEELRRQLGENLVGAFAIAARSMKMSTVEFNKFVASGKLMASDFLPKFAAQLRKEMEGELPNALDKTVQAINRTRNTFFEFAQSLASEIAPAFKDLLGDISDGIESIDTKKLGGSISDGIRTLGSALQFATEHAEALKNILIVLIGIKVAQWVHGLSAALMTAATRMNVIVGIAVALGLGLKKLHDSNVANSPFLPLIAGADEMVSKLEATQTEIAVLGEKAPTALVEGFEKGKKDLLVKINELSALYNSEMARFAEDSSFAVMGGVAPDSATAERLRVLHDEVMRLSESYVQLVRDGGGVVEMQEELGKATDKVADKLRENNAELRLLYDTMMAGGDSEFVKSAFKQGLTVKEVQDVTNAKHKLAKENFILEQSIEGLEKLIKDEAAAWDKLNESMNEEFLDNIKEIGEEYDKLQAKLREDKDKAAMEIGGEHMERMIEIMKIAKYGPGADELAKLDALRDEYERIAGLVEMKFGPEGAQRVMKEFEKRTREALDIETPKERWMAAAQTMADAFEAMGGRMGDTMGRIINGIMQMVSLFTQFQDLVKDTNAMNAAASGGGGGGIFGAIGGFFSNMFGGEGGKNFIGPPRPGGGGFGGFFGRGTSIGARGQGALMGAGMGAGIADILGQFGIGGKTYASGEKADYSSEGGMVGGAIGGAFGPAGAAIGGAIGTIAGSLIKRGADTALGAIDAFTGKVNITKSQGKAGEALRKVATSIEEGLSAINALVGGGITKFGAVGLKNRGGIYSVFGGGDAFRTKDAEAAVKEALLRSIKNADLSGLSVAMQKAIMSPLSDSIEAMEQNIKIALAIDKLGVPQFKSGLQDAMDSLRELGEAGKALGLDTTKVSEEMARTMKEARDQILGIEQTEQEKRLDEARQYNEVLAAERQRAQDELEALTAQLAQTTSVDIPSLVNDGLLPALDKFGEGLGTLASDGLGETNDEIQKRIQELEALLRSLAGLEISEQDVLDSLPEDPEKKKKREDHEDEVERRQREREAKREAAFAALSTPLEDTRVQIEQWGEHIDFLRNQVREGGVELERFNQIMAEFKEQVNVEFGSRLASFAEEYYGEFAENETLKRQMEQLNFDLRLAQLKLEFKLLTELGLLSAETIANAQSVFDYIDSHPPRFGEEIEKELEQALSPVEHLIKEIAEAGNLSPFQQAVSNIFGLIDGIYAMLPEGTMVRGVRVTGGGYTSTLPPVPRDLRRGEFSIANSNPQTTWEPFRLILGEMMSVEQARFEIAKAMQLIQLEVYKQQLHAAGIFNFDEMIDGAAAIVAATEYMAETQMDIARQQAEIWETIAESQRSALEEFNGLFGKYSGEGDDPVAQVKEDFARMRHLFKHEMSAQDQVDFLAKHGIASGLFDPNRHEKGFDLLNELELDAIAKALEDVADALQPIRDYFDDLRLSGANLTTQERYENTLSEFNEAFAANDIARAVEMARLLTGEVGIAQFGTSGQAYQDLQDFLVSTLGSLLPEGPPPDLMSQSVAFQERSTLALEAMYERAHVDADRIVTAVEENTAVRRTEAGRV